MFATIASVYDDYANAHGSATAAGIPECPAANGCLGDDFNEELQEDMARQKAARTDVRIRKPLTEINVTNRGGRRPLTDQEADFMVAQAELLRTAYNKWKQETGKSHTELPRLGIALTNWYAYITAKSCPSTVKMVRIASIFGVPAASLIPDVQFVIKPIKKRARGD